MPCGDCSTDDQCRCGPGEMCGDCFESRVQPEDVPRVLAAIGRVRTVLETEAVVGRSALDYRGLITAALLADEEPEPSTNEVCRCGHIRFRHQREDAEDRHCSLPSCPCTDFEQKAKPVMDASLPEEPHEHKHEYQTGGVFKCACGAISVPRTSEEMSALRQAERAHRQLMAHVQEGSAAGEMAPEPPLTPEEEEQAPEDVQCMHKVDGCRFPLTNDCEHGCRDAASALTQEAPEYDRCVCGASRAQHVNAEGPCYSDDCECMQFQSQSEEPPPPQPDRRPPYAVSYSVRGHLFEVALPGDASVRAVDGALVIQHHLGPVLGIVQVLPVVNEEGS
jgi:hypothetical protein